MLKFWKNYRMTILLFCGLIIGGIAGLFWGSKVNVIKPFGDLFLNLMYMILIPLVFFSISSAIASMSEMKRLGKILVWTLLVFLGTAFIAAILGYLTVLIFQPINNVDMASVRSLMGHVKGATNHVSGLEQLVNTFTVDDFDKI